MKKSILLLAVFCSIRLFAQNEIYELRTYELYQSSNFKDFNAYFEQHFIPFLNRQGIQNIGVFQEVSENLPRKVFVFIPYANMETYQKAHASLSEAGDLLKASTEKNPISRPMFNRYETSLYVAFDGMPKMKKPNAQNRFFELRTYESHSEEAYRRKVNMFNEGELELFDDLDFGSVFFGDKIAGGRMPCLTYMLAFESLEERNENWDKFRVHPIWTRLKNDPAYKDSCCSSITRVFLAPMSYSQF